MTTPNTSRGVERTRRRAEQAAAPLQVKQELAMSNPGTLESRQELIDLARAADASNGGKRSRTKAAQARNAALAKVEVQQLTSVAKAPLPVLVPGEQADLNTIRAYTQVTDDSILNDADAQARKIGLAARSIITGAPLRNRKQRARSIAQHNAKVAATAAK